MPEQSSNDDCLPTLAAIQGVLDGDCPVAVLDADSHAVGCLECRSRIAEARVLLAALALPAEQFAVPSGFAIGVLSGIRADRGARSRRRVFAAVSGGLALAASLLVGIWVMNGTAGDQVVAEQTRPAPELRPVRVSAEFAKAGDALRESSRPIVEPAAAAPKVFASLAGALLPPMTASAGDAVAPAAVSFAELPAAARTGLEPVAGTTQKAFTRLLRDVNVFSARPKS